jgi:subtilisin family serine protease
VLSRAVDRLNHSMVIVAAAGNHGNSADPLHRQPTWPAALPDVVAVGARDGDELASFSPKLPWVTCTAPGVRVEGAYLEGLVQTPHSEATEQDFSGYARWSGTSFATATTSGAIAAHIQRDEDEHYVVTPHQALAQVLAKEHGVVRPFTECDDGDCA